MISAGRRFQTLVHVLPLVVLSACGGGGSGGTGGSGGNGQTDEAPTFTAEITEINITRLDNNKPVSLEGSTESGATITVE